jgi:acetyl esterase/lipase
MHETPLSVPLSLLVALCLALSIPVLRAEAPTTPGFKVLPNLAYVNGGAEHQKLDLYLPETADHPLPLIIWIHGGGFSAGDKSNPPAQRMLDQGYAVASINYRLSGEALFPAQIEDCKSAVRWLRKRAREFHLDPDHFGAWGSSAGGHLVALLGTSGHAKEFEMGDNKDISSQVQAVCDYFGPTDILQMDAHALPTAPFNHDAPNSPESRLIGGPIQENKEKAARVNPITYISADAPPFLIVHGDQDPLVPYHQSQLLFEALQKAGVSAHLHTIHGAGHGSGFSGKNIDDMVNDFFARNLKNPPASNSGPEALQTESTASAISASQTRAGAVARQPIPWDAILARDDHNHDGKISREEFSGPPALFDRIDINHDSFITREEHEAFEAQRSAQPPASTPRP